MQSVFIQSVFIHISDVSSRVFDLLWPSVKTSSSLSGTKTQGGTYEFIQSDEFMLLGEFIFEKIRPWARGLRLMRLKTIGRGQGGHPWWAHPYSSWLSSIKASKAIAGQRREIRSECIRNASVTPRNTEYTKYDPPSAQVSDDALAQKYLLYTPPARLKRKI